MIEYITGKINKVKIVDVTNPPITTRANGFGFTADTCSDRSRYQSIAAIKAVMTTGPNSADDSVANSLIGRIPSSRFFSKYADQDHSVLDTYTE